MAVTKGFGADAVRAALAAGLTDIGENYADELVAKAAASWPGTPEPGRPGVALPRGRPAEQGGPAGPAGGLLAGRSPDRGGPGHRPAPTRAPGSWSRWTWPACPAGAAVPPGGVAGLVAALRDEDLDVAGLMAVGRPGPPEEARPGFRQVARLADALGLPVRSMGMTDDLEVALAEGSTMVRLGRALFGDRPPPPD